jgi:hypothetical protein
MDLFFEWAKGGHENKGNETKPNLKMEAINTKIEWYRNT